MSRRSDDLQPAGHVADASGSRPRSAVNRSRVYDDWDQVRWYSSACRRRGLRDSARGEVEITAT